MDNHTLLVKIYCYIADTLKTDISYHVMRMSNNSKPQFTDEKVITIFLFGIINKRKELKCIYNFIKNYYHSWFPKLPSYVGFISRLNRVSCVFAPICQQMISDYKDTNVIKTIMLIDAMPIVIANAKRSSQAKVASAWANKGYCASKKMVYYGVKLHIIGFKRPGTMPLSDYMLATPASIHDLTLLKDIFSQLGNIDIYADKAYCDEVLKKILNDVQNVNLYTPVKRKKGQKYLHYD